MATFRGIACVACLVFSFGSAFAQEVSSSYAISKVEDSKPKKVEVAVDEMLAICSEIDAWRDRKESLEANARYNELKYFGLE